MASNSYILQIIFVSQNLNILLSKRSFDTILESVKVVKIKKNGVKRIISVLLPLLLFQIFLLVHDLN